MEDYLRFIRQIQLPEIGIKGQEKLRASSVLMVGAGGLGCPILLSLTTMGIGKIGIVDNDNVSLSNLPRQTLFGISDIGKQKADAAVEQLNKFSAGTNFVKHFAFVNQNNVFELISSYDIIIDGTDNFITGYVLSDACSIMNKPLVYGGIYKYESQVAVFNYPDKDGISAGIRDLINNTLEDQNQIGCDIAGVINPLTGIAGNMMSAEVMKIILSSTEVLANKVLNFNLLSGRTSVFRINDNISINKIAPSTQKELENYSYKSISSLETNCQIEAENAIKLINDEKALLIDIRNDEEGLSLPFTFIRSSLLSNEFLIETSHTKPIIIVCASGARSFILAEHIRKSNPETPIYSLKGGVSELMRIL